MNFLYCLWIKCHLSSLLCVALLCVGCQVLNNEYGQELALTAARESIVLLQNNASTLPLAVGTDVKEVLIVGPIAQNTQVMMGGKNDYCPEHTVSLLEGLQALANSSANVAASSGAAWRVVYNDGSNMASAVKAAKEADFVIITRGGVQGHEGADRSVLTLDDQSMDAVTDAVCEAVSATKLALVVVVGEPVALDMYVETSQKYLYPVRVILVELCRFFYSPFHAVVLQVHGQVWCHCPCLGRWTSCRHSLC